MKPVWKWIGDFKKLFGKWVVVFSVLHYHRDEILAFHCKVVSLTLLNRFEEVLTVLNREKEFAKLVLSSKNV